MLGIWFLLFPLLCVLVIGGVICAIVIPLVYDGGYSNSEYYKATKIQYHNIVNDKGRWGEYIIYNILKPFSNLYGAKFLFNVYVPKSDGTTSEIDIVMVCRKGIFVIECKNYSGWIFGNENYPKWFKTLPAGKFRSVRKETFYNPVMQNRAHINHLKSLIGYDNEYKSVVVFAGDSVLKEINLTSDAIVTKHFSAFATIREYCNTGYDCLNDTDVMNIYERLYSYTQTCETEKLEHIDKIEEKYRLNSADIQTGVYSERCPLCGKELILHKTINSENRISQFYGCSDFPNCTYVRKDI